MKSSHLRRSNQSFFCLLSLCINVMTTRTSFCVKDFRHFYYCTSDISIMKVIIPMNMKDIFSYCIYREVSSHHTQRMLLQNEQFVNNITLNKLHLPLGLQLNMHMMTISALHRIYTYTFPHEQCGFFS